MGSLARALLQEDELSGLLSRAVPTPAAVEGGFGFGAPGVHAAVAAVEARGGHGALGQLCMHHGALGGLPPGG